LSEGIDASTRPFRILVVYYSRFGVLKLLAERARRVPNVNASLLRVEDQPVRQRPAGEVGTGLGGPRAVMLSQLAGADALIIGRPAYVGSMAAAVKRSFDDALALGPAPAVGRQPLFRDKVGAAFTASGTPRGGNEMALHSILTMFMHLGMLVVTAGRRQPVLDDPGAPYGATAITGPTGSQPPDEAEQEAARALGERVVGLRVHRTRRPSSSNWCPRLSWSTTLPPAPSSSGTVAPRSCTGGSARRCWAA
jgi:NAD(P)H dehydrogenase (quinone)